MTLNAIARSSLNDFAIHHLPLISVRDKPIAVTGRFFAHGHSMTISTAQIYTYTVKNGLGEDTNEIEKSQYWERGTKQTTPVI
jgi:hypothetical protein